MVSGRMRGIPFLTCFPRFPFGDLIFQSESPISLVQDHSGYFNSTALVSYRFIYGKLIAVDNPHCTILKLFKPWFKYLTKNVYHTQCILNRIPLKTMITSSSRILRRFFAPNVHAGEGLIPSGKPSAITSPDLTRFHSTWLFPSPLSEEKGETFL